MKTKVKVVATGYMKMNETPKQAPQSQEETKK